MGIVIAVLGDVIFVISVLTMKDSWRAGVLMMFFYWGLSAIPVFAMIMFHLQIVNVEEDSKQIFRFSRGKGLYRKSAEKYSIFMEKHRKIYP